VVYPVGWLTKQFCFVQIIDYNFEDLVWIAPKLVLIIAFRFPTSVPNFSQAFASYGDLFFVCVKRRIKKQEGLSTCTVSCERLT